MLRVVAVAQFGCPSVASKRYLGFWSVRPCRYEIAPSSARRVGVPTWPLNWLPVRLVVMAVAFIAATGTTGAVATPHIAGSSPR